ncbi:hypothetical protein [Draconibacterium sp.]
MGQIGLWYAKNKKNMAAERINGVEPFNNYRLQGKTMEEQGEKRSV